MLCAQPYDKHFCISTAVFPVLIPIAGCPFKERYRLEPHFSISCRCSTDDWLCLRIKSLPSPLGAAQAIRHSLQVRLPAPLTPIPALPVPTPCQLVSIPVHTFLIPTPCRCFHHLHLRCWAVAPPTPPFLVPRLLGHWEVSPPVRTTSTLVLAYHTILLMVDKPLMQRSHQFQPPLNLA